MSKDTKILSIVSIALGALAIVAGLFEYIIIGIFLGIAGVVISLGAKHKAAAAEEPITLAKIGFIVSCVGIAVCVVALILYIINEIHKASLFEGAIDAE